MIGEGLYIGITRYMTEMLTPRAVDGILCQYDGYWHVSPLWLTTHLNSGDPRLMRPMLDLVNLLIRLGAKAAKSTFKKP